MTKKLTDEQKKHRRLLKMSPVAQILMLTGIKFNDPDEAENMVDEEIGRAIFNGVQVLFTQWIEAGLTMDRERWDRWGQYEGGVILKDWWIHAKTQVEDLRIAKLAKLILDTLGGKGKIERIALEALPNEEQDVLIRRLTSKKA